MSATPLLEVRGRGQELRRRPGAARRRPADRRRRGARAARGQRRGQVDPDQGDQRRAPRSTRARSASTGGPSTFGAPADARARRHRDAPPGPRAVRQPDGASRTSSSAASSAARRWLGRLGLLDQRAMEREWQARLERLEVRIPDAQRDVSVMSGGQRQAIAVLRAVAFASRLVILDEPTAALGVRESGQVLDLVRRLPEQGVAVVLISHNLEHVSAVADRAVVLRQGRYSRRSRTDAGQSRGARVDDRRRRRPHTQEGEDDEAQVHGGRARGRRAGRRLRRRRRRRRSGRPERRRQAEAGPRRGGARRPRQRVLRRPEGGHRGRGGARRPASISASAPGASGPRRTR